MLRFTIAASGAKWINLDIDWNHIQYDGPTTWRWNVATDRVVLTAGTSEGIELALSDEPGVRAGAMDSAHC
jgi:hypothetical protein